MFDCEKCLHEEVCDQPGRQLWGTLNGEKECSDFKDRTNYVEVVHAHWEDGCAVDPKTGRIIYKSIDCSHCEEIFKIESHDREYWKKRFKVCPFCGAVMDGERKDNG